MQLGTLLKPRGQPEPATASAVVGGRTAAADCAGSTLNMTSLLSPAERLKQLRKRPQKSKEDLVQQVMQQAVMENRIAQQWRENEKARQESKSFRWESSDKLFSLMQLQVETMQRIATIQEEKHCSRCPHN